MLSWKINNKQEQILLYLYEFKNTPERGVGPDPLLKVQGIREGTQLPLNDVKRELLKLVSKALVRSVLVGHSTFYYLTVKGYNLVEKVQQKSFNVGIDEKGLSLGFRRSETQGAKTS